MNSHLITRSDWMIFNQCSECGVRGVVQIDRLSAARNECACPAILGRVRRRSQQWGALGCGRCRGLCWCWQWSEAGLEVPVRMKEGLWKNVMEWRCKEANSAHTYLELEPCGAWMSVLWCHYTNKQGKTDADQQRTDYMVRRQAGTTGVFRKCACDSTCGLHRMELWDLWMVLRIFFHLEFSRPLRGLGHFADSNSIP